MYSREEFIDAIKKYNKMSRADRGYFLDRVDELFDEIEASRKIGLSISNIPDREIDTKYMKLYRENYELKKSNENKNTTIMELERMLMLLNKDK